MFNDAALRSLLELSRLEVPEEQLKSLEGQLEEILHYFERLSSYDTSQVDVDLGSEREVTTRRPDERSPGLDREAIEEFSNSFDDGFFVVPIILGDDGE